MFPPAAHRSASAYDPARDAAKADTYIASVQRFAAKVLEFGVDHFGPEPTPLLVDGLNVATLKPVEWSWGDAGEHQWLYSNQLSHHVLFRTLQSLSRLTRDNSYVHAAQAAVGYAFKHLRGPSGLFYWGGHTAWDLRTRHWVGLRWKPDVTASPVHEMKYHLPHFDLLWDVDADVTRTYLEAMWTGHVINWDNLDLDRHADIEAEPKPVPWEHPWREPPVFFDGKGLTFQNFSTDLISAGVSLYLHTQQEAPLVWAHRLASRLVGTRDEKTGLGGFQFSCRPPDRAREQLGPQFPGHVVLEGTILHPVAMRMWAGQLLRLADKLGNDGAHLRQWALEDLEALARHSFVADPHLPVFRRMLTDGTDLTDVPLERGGYYGKAGKCLEPDVANMSFARVYLQAWRAEPKAIFWSTAGSIFAAWGFGDIGQPGGAGLKLAADATDDRPAAVHALLELYEITHDHQCLDAACGAADRLLARRFINDLFVDSPGSPAAQLNAREPLALLRLAAALRGKGEIVEDDPDGRRAFMAAKTKLSDPMYIHDFRRVYGRRRSF